MFVLPDTCYILSFAIIMLNTSLHNPNVKDKPTVERFISMNRGINDGGDLPEELLRVSLLLHPPPHTHTICLQLLLKNSYQHCIIIIKGISRELLTKNSMILKGTF